MTPDIISVPADYNIELNLRYLLRSDKEILHRITPEGIYKLIAVNGTFLLVLVTVSRETFTISYPVGVPSMQQRQGALRFVKDWFDLETDLTAFYAMAEGDKLLRSVVEQYRGYRIIGIPDLFESLCWAIIGQQINLSFAYTLKQRFVEQFGVRFGHKGEQYFAFPQTKVVASLTDADLLPLQFSRQKSKYVRFVADAFESGAVSQEYIGNLPFEEARQKLMAIKGVGNWTANYALMKTYRYQNAFPLEDAGLHNAIRKLKNLDEKPSVEQVRRLFKKYKGWEAYATAYLWKLAETPKV